MKPQAAQLHAAARLPDTLGRELLQALPTLRIYSVSLHDQEGQALWLSEGTLGPDEHSAALEAMSAMEFEPQRACVCIPLGDNRTAACLPARSPGGDLLGVALIVADGKGLEFIGEAKLAAPPAQAVLRKLAAQLAPPMPITPPAPRTAQRAAAPVRAAPELDLSLDAADLAPQRPLARAAEAPLGAAGEEATLALPRPNRIELALFVQQLLKLRSGGRTRRYEVLLRSRLDPTQNGAPRALLQASSENGKSSALDRHVLAELLTFMAAHSALWQSEPASFSMNLCPGTLLDVEFPGYVARRLEEAGVAPESIGFEIPQAVCIEHRRRVEKLIVACEHMGCHVVLDDFTMHSEAVPLLASKAVRLVKIDARLTASAMSEKLSQALVIAISQASKVLGAHCVAKRIETPRARQWLAAIGIDFAQGFLLEKPAPLESLVAAGG